MLEVKNVSVKYDTATILDEAQTRNFQKFNILNQFVWPNSYIGGNYLAEVNYLKTWIDDRLEWLDWQIGGFFTTSIDDETVQSVETGNRLVVYPNPFTDRFALCFKLSKKAKADIRFIQMKLI